MNKPPILQIIFDRLHINFNRKYSTYTDEQNTTIKRWDWSYIGLGFTKELFNYYNVHQNEVNAWGISILGFTIYKANTLDYIIE